MAALTHGSVSVEIPAHIPVPQEAGSLTIEQLRQLETARGRARV